MHDTHVAIVGGGLAGLCAAHALRQAAVPFLLIEARDRLGGRILTVDQQGTPATDGFDLGPSWFWPDAQPAIGELVIALGLTAFAQHSTGDVLFERMSREGPQRYAAYDHQPRSFRLAGGSAALVRALSASLEPREVLRRARVTALRLDDAHVTLALSHPDREEQLVRAEHVILALPPRLLASTITMMPTPVEADVERWRATPTWMAPHAKFFAVYARPFWREAGLSGTAQSMVGPLPEIHDATSASGQAALFGFVGVSAAQRAELGEPALTRACLAQLERLFGAEAAHPVVTLLKDWAADPLTATHEDQTAGGHPVVVEQPWISAPWRARVHFAGSETSPNEPGYLAGAVTAAARAVTEIVGERET